MTQTHDLLGQILNRIRSCRDTESQALVVFDLDSTLFDVSPRTQRIVLDFSADPQNRKRFPQSTPALEQVRVLSKDWGIRTALTRHGLHTHAPEFHEAVRDYWIQRFFSGEYLQYDHPIEGAVSYTWKVADAGARLVYLSGRDQTTMYEASQKVLEVHGFPPGEIVLKPKKGSDDAEFKVDWFDQQDLSRYNYCVFFENEPVNLHHVHERHPDIDLVFVESTHSGKASVSESWPRILDFRMAE